MFVAVATWQTKTSKRFDLIIQAGDIGAYPNKDQTDPADDPHFAADPSEADFARMLKADGKQAEALRSLRQQFASPVYCIRGNHEDFDWLNGLPQDQETGIARMDSFDLLHYVPDGTVQQFGDVCIAFLGGEETDESDPGAIDRDAYESLMELEPGKVDLLVTHDGPYGLSIGYHGQTQGSQLITDLVAHIQPTYHVSGHYHMNGPRMYGETTYLCLSHITKSRRWYPDAQGLQEGCLAVLDTDDGTLAPVTDSWLESIETPVDLGAWYTPTTDIKTP